MDVTAYRASASLVIAAPPEKVYEFIADMPRVGEISPVCTGGTWESDQRGVGATFVGSNTVRDRTWQARMRVTVADAPREFAWENIGSSTEPVADDAPAASRWSYRFAPVGGGTEVTESWMMFDNPGLAGISPEQLEKASTRNRSGMEETLARLKQLLEAGMA
ncbi:MAG TPA: SRPBCC family protein [Acidimicrobiales bacterium]|jgi:carbon monoxide dehydrogenase subunit G